MSSTLKRVAALFGTLLIKLAVAILRKAGEKTLWDVDTPESVTRRWKRYVEQRLKEQQSREKQ